MVVLWDILLRQPLIGLKVVKNLSRSQSFTSLILPLSLSLVFSSFIWATLNNEIYGANMKRFLTWGYIFIFVIWQFAQAWWMRVPFKEIALRKMASTKRNSTNLGILLNFFHQFLDVNWGSVFLCSFHSNFRF